MEQTVVVADPKREEAFNRIESSLKSCVQLEQLDVVENMIGMYQKRFQLFPEDGDVMILHSKLSSKRQQFEPDEVVFD